MPTAVIDLTEMVRMAMQGPKRSPLFKAWESRAFVWITSEKIVAEFIEVAHRPKLQRMIRPLVLDAVIKAIRVNSRFVTPAVKFPVCRDPKDNIIIATATAARSDFIVTSDNDMLDDETLSRALSEYHIRAILPGEFLNLLQNRKS
jgi:putative PIN family toxin of toxin-antitoxin system